MVDGVLAWMDAVCDDGDDIKVQPGNSNDVPQSVVGPVYSPPVVPVLSLHFHAAFHAACDLFPTHQLRP